MIKKLFLGCFLLLAAAAGGVFLLWRQATRLPDWYEDMAARPAASQAEDTARREDPSGSSSRGAAGGTSETREADGSPAETSGGGAGTSARPSAPAPPSTAGRQDPPAEVDLRPVAGRVELDERELNELLQRGLREHGQGLGRAVRAARAAIRGDRLEVGVVTHFADLTAAADGGRESEAIRRLGRLVPWLQDREFFVAASGTPEVRDGHLVFSRGLEVQVGGFAFDAAELAGRLGVRQEKIDRGLAIPVADLDVEGVEVADGALVLFVRQ